MGLARVKVIAAPRAMGVSGKRGFAPTPRPGPHPKEECIPLLSLVKKLGYTSSSREVKTIIKRGEIQIDGKVRKDPKFPVGLFDSVSVPKTKEHYRILPSKVGFELKKISAEAAKVKPCRIKNKTAVRGGKIQLNMHDGKNILLKKNRFSTGDTLVLKLPELKIEKHIRLARGYLAMLVGGKNRGSFAKIKDIKTIKGPAENRIFIKLLEGKKMEREVNVPARLIFVVGRDRPVAGI